MIMIVGLILIRRTLITILALMTIRALMTILNLMKIRTPMKILMANKKPLMNHLRMSQTTFIFYLHLKVVLLIAQLRRLLEYLSLWSVLSWKTSAEI